MTGLKGRVITLVLVALLVLHGSLISAQTLRDDEQHLFTFLQNTLPGYPAPFNLSVPTCQWQGLSCIGLGPQQRFYALSLKALGLNGTIPYQTLGALTSLKILDLSNNQLTGEIPYDVYTLPNLVQLDISNNTLTGSLPQWVNLFQLQRLDLSRNLLNGSISDTFGVNLKSLNYLNLHGNNFSGPLPALDNSKFLSYLDVSANQFTGGIPFSMFSILELGFLNVSWNLLSGPIPFELNWLWKMRVLDLSENNFKGPIPDLYNFGQLTGFSAAMNSLNGSLPYNLTRLPSLQSLDLHNNFLSGNLPTIVSPITFLDLRHNQFSGGIPGDFLASGKTVVRLGGNQFMGPIPTNVSVQIQDMDLGSNQFNGSIPWSSIAELAALKYLNLGRNGFDSGALPSLSKMVNLNLLNLSSCNVNGAIPDSVGDLQSLVQLDLSHNMVSGNIPTNFSRTTNLTSLDMSHNKLTGEIPREIASLASLTRLDLSFNNLSGEVPFENQWRFFGNTSFEGNALLCGVVLNKLCLPEVAPPVSALAPAPTAAALPPPYVTPETPVIVPPILHRHVPRGVAPGTVAGIVIGLALALCAFLITYFVFRKQHKYKKSKTRKKDNFSYLTGPVTFEADPCAWASQVPQPASIPVIMFEKPLLNLTFADLLQATSKFHKDSQIADGRYGPTFKGSLPGGFRVVVKVLYDGGPANELEKAAQLEALGKIRHENLVSLVGYCLVGEERLLVYEFMENEDVHQHLHDSLEETHHPDNWTKESWADANEKFISDELGWPIRHRIAVGVARALAFLHHGCVPNVVHRDVTSKNIMLDGQYEPHLSDCGLAELVETGKRYESPVMGGTLGYVPPEYSQTWKATARGDVYSFGVVLLELVTGKRPTGQYYFESYGGNLVGWVRTLIREKRGFKCLDPRLLSSGVESEMLETLRIGYLCTAELPSKRPTMQQVVGLLKDIHVDVVTCMLLYSLQEMKIRPKLYRACSLKYNKIQSTVQYDGSAHLPLALSGLLASVVNELRVKHA